MYAVNKVSACSSSAEGLWKILWLRKLFELLPRQRHIDNITVMVLRILLGFDLLISTPSSVMLLSKLLSYFSQLIIMCLMTLSFLAQFIEALITILKGMLCFLLEYTIHVCSSKCFISLEIKKQFFIHLNCILSTDRALYLQDKFYFSKKPRGHSKNFLVRMLVTKNVKKMSEFGLAASMTFLEKGYLFKVNLRCIGFLFQLSFNIKGKFFLVWLSLGLQSFQNVFSSHIFRKSLWNLPSYLQSNIQIS